jgi:hypothetical protein
MTPRAASAEVPSPAHSCCLLTHRGSSRGNHSSRPSAGGRLSCRRSTTSESARPRAKGLVRRAPVARSHPARCAHAHDRGGTVASGLLACGVRPMPRESDGAAGAAGLKLHGYRSAGAEPAVRRAGRDGWWRGKRHSEAGAAARAEAVVARPDRACLDVSDRDMTSSSLDRQSRASTVTFVRRHGPHRRSSRL